MAIRSGVRNLLNGLRSYLEGHGVTAEVAFGTKALSSQVKQGTGRANRIVLAPFDEKGAGGRLVEPSQVGKRDIMSMAGTPIRTGSVRALADWQRLMVVSVWAYDGSRPEDELAQEEALEDLLEWALRAIHWTGFAEAVWDATTFRVQGERRFGLEVRMFLRFTHPLFDVPTEVGHPEGLTINKGFKDED